ncbi:MAG: peroxidase family protein [Actinomycetota bacterium]
MGRGRRRSDEGWDRLPRFLGILTLVGLRNRLRERNLHDTGLTPDKETLEAEEPSPRERAARTIDGRFNDLGHPAMGSLGSRFGRNVALRYTRPEEEPDVLRPNPRMVSRELLTRDRFIPASTLNLLAAAWLQFEVHDWFSHAKGDEENSWRVPLQDDDPWPRRPMQIPRTVRDPSGPSSSPPTYLTADSHWWDASQIYGSDETFASRLRTGDDGMLRLDDLGLIPEDLEKAIDLAGVAGNFWVGLALLHSLFMREHNAICHMLRAGHPSWSDDDVYNHARLVNAALMAKIHTVEWTPAIIAHPTTRLAMRANWWGLAGERVAKRWGRISSSDVLSGIPGSETDHHGVPYSLTEEFVAVYRMHPLIPDDYEIRSASSDAVLGQRTFRELGVLDVRQQIAETGMTDFFYSFGRSHPGAITLHNYPRFLQELRRPDGSVVDLAAVDIMRSRERGVPRYNQFRRLFHMRPARRFDEVTDNPEWARELARVYDDVEKIDLTVGLYAEPLPKGFGFSDSAFRVFILMASRRLKSDRFFTVDYTPKVYSQEGLDWINDNTLKTVLLRHFPSLAPALAGLENAFVPWAVSA